MIHKLPQNVHWCAVVGVPLRVGVAECVRVDLGSVEGYRVTVRVELVAVQRLQSADPRSDGAADAVAAEVFLHDRRAGEEVLPGGRGGGAADLYPFVDRVGGGLQYREPPSRAARLVVVVDQKR